MSAESEILKSIMEKEQVPGQAPESVELDEEDSGVVEHEDGSATVSLDDEAPDTSGEFYDNLAESLPEDELEAIATTLVDLIAKDKEARAKRDQQYEEGLKRTGLGNDAPGGAQFDGASKVVHPMLIEACVDFAARAIKELFPPMGPAKDFIPGKPTSAKIEKAQRKTKFMNWQLTQQMPEFRSELEQLLTQVPMGGVQYLKLTWDSRKKRPVGEFVPIDDVFLPFASTNYYSSPRKTHRQYLTKLDYDSRVRSGMYRDVDIPGITLSPEFSKAETANQKIEGKEDSSYNEDGLREVYEISAVYDVPDELRAKEERDEEEDDKDEGPAPYLITIDKTTRRVLSVYRNWAEEDDTEDELIWMVEFPFVPWRGVYAIGLPHMIGGLSGAATGALRSLLDAALISNFPGMLKLKSQIGGQSQRIDATQVNEVDGGLAVDDVRKLAMPIPVNPPSSVLYQLLGFVVEAGKGVVRTTLDESESNQNVPVGTMMARIEQGMVVFSSIHARLHEAMGRVLKVLHRIDATYLDDDGVVDDTGEAMAFRKDFTGPMDVVPVSDPNIFSEMQRFSQMQTLAQRAGTLPQLYDLRKVEIAILERMKIPDAEQYLNPLPEPVEMNGVNENIAAALGRPVMAFPTQDHLAHLQMHLDFMASPMLGSSVLMAQRFVPAMSAHIAEHISLWYATEIHRVASAAAGTDIAEFQRSEDVDVKRKFDQVLAAASQHVMQSVPQVFQKVPQVLAGAMQVMAQLAPPMQGQDPTAAAAAAAKAETDRKSAADQQNSQLKVVEIKDRQQARQDKQQGDAQREAARQAHDEKINTQRQQSQLATAAAHDATQKEIAAQSNQTTLTAAQIAADAKIDTNTADNETAMDIADKEIASGEKVAVSTGGGLAGKH